MSISPNSRLGSSWIIDRSWPEWKPSYQRGSIMQATLALLGFVFGAAAWWLTRNLPFLVGGLLMLANWPWTLLVIRPVNRILMATEPTAAGGETRALLMKWSRLHAVRTTLAAAATLVFLWALW